MTDETSASGAALFGRPLLAGVCVVLWIAAAAITGRVGIWPAIGGAATLLGGLVFVCDGAESRRILRPSARLILVGAAAGGSMAAVTFFLYPLFIRTAPDLTGDVARLYAAFRAPSLLVASLALTPVIVGEELIWRSLVQSALTDRCGRLGGVGLAACAYALTLAPLGSPVLVLAALACGLGWGALRAGTGSLVPSVVAHLVWDVAVLLLLPLSP